MVSENKSKVIENIEQLLAFRGSQPKFIFRGHSSQSWILIPAIDVRRTNNADTTNSEENHFKDFKTKIDGKGYFSQELEHNDFRILGLAQHYQRLTRLLDWTTDILIALYFACFDIAYRKENGAIWFFTLPGNFDDIWIKPQEEADSSPFSFKEPKIFICRPFIDDYEMLLPSAEGDVRFGNNRDSAQMSVMTLHPKIGDGIYYNVEDIKQKYELQKLIIPSQSKSEFLGILDKDYYINDDTLFRGVLPSEIKSKREWNRITTAALEKYKTCTAKDE